MKTPAQIVVEGPSRWGAPRLADLFRRAMSGERRTAAELDAMEASWKAEETAAREEHARRQQETWPEHLAKCGAPPRVLEALRKPLDTPAVLAAREMLAAHKQNLVLSGWTGTGKTAAACLLFGAARSRETRTGHNLPEWDAAHGLFLDLRRLIRVTDALRFTRSSELPLEDRNLFTEACRVRVLVLDEVGGEPGEVLVARHKQLIEELVDRRDYPGRLTAYTTNLSLQRNGSQPSDFGAFVGARVVSRIGRSCVLRDCGTKDLRARP